MDRRSRLGSLLVVAGVGIGLLSLRVGGATARACPGIDGVLYEMVGIHLGGVAITGVDLAAGSIEWYDGCNWRTTSFVPLVAGALVSIAGLVALRSTGTPATK